MSILDRLISTIAPYECLACGNEGALLCLVCTGLLSTLPERCYRCRKLSPSFKTCSSCRHASKIYRLRVYTDYDFVAKALVGRLKFAGAQSAALIIAKLLTELLVQSERTIIVPVPTATSRVRQRGYDQARLIARQLAKRTKTPYAHCLVREGHTHQVGASRRQRLTQLSTAFRMRRITSVKGAHIILVDDVMTTGATLESAAKVLKKAGAKRVDAIVFAQP